MTGSTDTISTTPDTERLFGIVKWFDKMKGYGFVQQLHTENDYFVHYSQLQCDDDQRTKYLVAGEYIQFNISEPVVGTTTVNDDTPSQVAVDVSGILNGPLMYETQQSNRTYQQRNDTFRFPRHTSQRRRIQEQPVQLRRNQNEDETRSVPQGNQYEVLSSYDR